MDGRGCHLLCVFAHLMGWTLKVYFVLRNVSLKGYSVKFLFMVDRLFSDLTVQGLWHHRIMLNSVL